MTDNTLEKDDFAMLLKHMPEGHGVLMDKMPDGNMKITLIKPEELKSLGEEPGLYHIIYQFSRVGTGYFANYLEYKHFKPETPENDEFKYRVINWNGMLWCVISIPAEKKELAQEAAQVSGIRIADGIPMMAGGMPIIMVAAIRKEKLKDFSEEMQQSVKWFPLDTDNAFTLEYVHDSDAYQSGGTQDIKAMEEFKLKKLWEECEVPEDPTTPYDPWKV